MQSNDKTSKHGRVIKKPQACERLVISQRTLDYKISRGEIPYLKFGGAVRFLESDIDDYIARHRVAAKKSGK
jgi:excisionase family DNA binding protein